MLTPVGGDISEIHCRIISKGIRKLNNWPDEDDRLVI